MEQRFAKSRIQIVGSALKKSCKSNIRSDYFNLPAKRAKKKSLHLNFKIHYKENKIFLIRDNALGFWKNLWMPPYEVCKNNNYDIRHTLSHRDLFIEFKKAKRKLINLKMDNGLRKKNYNLLQRPSLFLINY